MTTEEEIEESLAICENLSSYDDFDKVVSEIQSLSDELLPKEEGLEADEKKEEQTEQSVEEKGLTMPATPSAVNVKYDEVTRPIPTIKGVPVVDPPVEQSGEKTEESQNEQLTEPAEQNVKSVVEQSVKEEEAKQPIEKKQAAAEQPVSEEETEEEYEETNKKKDIVKGIISLLLCVGIAIGVSFCIIHFVAHHTKVDGSSMEANLHDGDDIIVEKISYYMHDPERYDVIVFPFSDNVYYIKRVIGLPGESIQIKDGKIYIDGVQLWEQYGNAMIEDPGLAKEEIVLGKDEYFVLGDNRNSSIDSRKAEVGVVKRDNIVGKAWLRFYPFSDFGLIE